VCGIQLNGVDLDVEIVIGGISIRPEKRQLIRKERINAPNQPWNILMLPGRLRSRITQAVFAKGASFKIRSIIGATDAGSKIGFTIRSVEVLCNFQKVATSHY